MIYGYTKYRVYLTLIIALLCLGFKFNNLYIDGYRVFYGRDKQVDWIDVCCEFDSKFNLTYKDTTPIEKVEYKWGCYVFTKKHSIWMLCDCCNIEQMYLKRID